MPLDQNRILAEQLSLLFKALPISLAGSILNAIILVSVLWTVVDHTELLVWLVIFLLVSLARGVVLFLYHHRQTNNIDLQQYRHYFFITTLLAGLCWGAVGLWLFPADSLPHQAIIVFVLAGNSAAAIISLSYIGYIALAFVLTSLLPPIFQLLLLQTDLNNAMGAMTILFLLLAMSGIRRNEQNTRQNITLRMESVEHEMAMLESQQKLALHVQQTPLAVIEWSTDFRVTDWNPAAEKIFGYKKSDAIGRYASDIIIPEDTDPLVSDIWANLLQQKGGLQSINDNITRDGQRITCEWYNTPLVNRQGKVIGVASLARDITRRKQVENMQNDFISTVSHELRTPLTSIRGAMGLLQGEALEPGSEEYRHIVEIASSNTERLLLIISDILDIQKIEAGKMEFDFQSVVLQPFLTQAVEANQAYADQFQVNLCLQTSNENLIVRADPNRLMQVMYNLLSNAVKYSQRGQTVEVTMQRHGDMARIMVSDHGIGIAPEFIDHVFERFARVDNSNTRQVGGTGLGLSIVKNIVEQHDGSISLDSTPGRGSRFYVDLPLI